MLLWVLVLWFSLFRMISDLGVVWVMMLDVFCNESNSWLMNCYSVYFNVKLN